MKRVLIITILRVLLLFTNINNVAAQTTKFGYFDLDYVVSLIPSVGKVDSLLAVYEQDSLNQQYQVLVKEYQFHDSLMRVHGCSIGFNFDTAERAASFRNAYLLQNWMQYSQQTLQTKRQQLIQPFYNKVMITYQEVVDEGKYAYVFKRDALLHAPQSDNLSIAVIKKLGIEVTDEILQRAVPAMPRILALPKLHFPVMK